MTITGAKYKKTKKTGYTVVGKNKEGIIVGEGIENVEPSYSSAGNLKWWKTAWQKVKLRTTIELSGSTPVYPKALTTATQTDT